MGAHNSAGGGDKKNSLGHPPLTDNNTPAVLALLIISMPADVPPKVRQQPPARQEVEPSGQEKHDGKSNRFMTEDARREVETSGREMSGGSHREVGGRRERCTDA
jgi:hypothetical protein